MSRTSTVDPATKTTSSTVTGPGGQAATSTTTRSAGTVNTTISK